MLQLILFAVEFAVMILCLPFYLVVVPLMIWQETRIAGKIRQLVCGHCDARLDGVSRRMVLRCGVKKRLSPGAVIDWERQPAWMVKCPQCQQDVFFNRKLRQVPVPAAKCNSGSAQRR